MKYIQAKTKLVGVPPAIVDDSDYDLLSKMKWNVTRKHGTQNYYYHTRVNGKWLKMHRFILGNPLHEVDHINHITNDNRRVNLRVVQKHLNDANRITRYGSSIYKGVQKSRNRWRSIIRINGVRYSIGTYLTQDEAAVAYNKAAKEAWGEFAYVNKLST